MTSKIPENVVEDLLGGQFAPADINLAISCNPGRVVVGLGNTIKPQQVLEKPSVMWNAEPHAFYTLALLDLDNPSRKEPKDREMLHWLVVNIPGTNVAGGDTVAEYVPSAPPEKTGLHRYVYVINKQQGRISPQMPHIPADVLKGRANFKLRGFLQGYQLTPMALRFYQAEWDETVPGTYEKIKG